MNQTDLTTLLRPLDAAQGFDADTADSTRRRQEAMLQRVLAAPAVPTATAALVTRTRPVVRFAIGGLAAALLVPALLVGGTYVTHRLSPASDSASASSFTTAQLASWVSTPQPRTTETLSRAVKQWCTDATAGQAGADADVAFSNADQRGQIASAIITRGGYRDLCLASPDHTGYWEIIDGPSSALRSVGSHDVVLQSAGSHGDAATSVNSVWGQAGSDITSMVLHVDGRDITATVGAGIWSAWWPSQAVSFDGPTTATITDTSGRTTTVQITVA